MNIKIHKQALKYDATEEATQRLFASAIRGIAARNPLYINQCKPCVGALNGCQEWKPSASMRNVCEAEVRVVFYVRDDTVYVLSAYYRENNEVFRRAVYRYRQPVFA